MKQKIKQFKKETKNDVIHYACSDLLSWIRCQKVKTTLRGEAVWHHGGGKEKFKEELLRFLGYMVAAAGIGALANDRARNKLLYFLDMGLQHITKNAPLLI